MLSMKHSEFIKNLKSDVPAIETLHPVKRKFLDDLHGGKKIQTMFGAFGPETPNTDAYIEEVIKPEYGGTFVKLYGCSYLYKGTYDAEKVHGASLAKSMLSDMAIKFMKAWPISLGFALSYLFARQRLVDAIYWMFYLVEDRVLRWYDIPESEYNAFPSEIKRATKEVLGSPDKNTLEGAILKMMNFIAFVLQIDNGYRFRFQDALEEAYLRGQLDIFGVLDVLIEREVPNEGIGRKWKMLKIALKFIFLTNWKLRRITDAIFKEIRIGMVRPDNADRYFSLLFKSYDFRGKDFEFRSDIKSRLDRENGHVFLT